MISIRLSDEENMKFEEMKRQTGLSTTALIKKKLFKDNSGNNNINKEILIHIGELSTNVNVLKFLSEDDMELDCIYKMERSVEKLWQSL